jgi:hypothetical protein
MSLATVKHASRDREIVIYRFGFKNMEGERHEPFQKYIMALVYFPVRPIVRCSPVRMHNLGSQSQVYI